MKFRVLQREFYGDCHLLVPYNRLVSLKEKNQYLVEITCRLLQNVNVPLNFLGRHDRTCYRMLSSHSHAFFRAPKSVAILAPFEIYKCNIRKVVELCFLTFKNFFKSKVSKNSKDQSFGCKYIN